MGRPPGITPREHFHITMDASLKQKVDLFLFSEVEGRIPKGAQSQFAEARFREFFDSGTLTLDRYGFPPGYFVNGPREMLVELAKRLEKL